MPPSNLQHGSRTLVYVNGQLYGLCTGFNWSVRWGRKDIQGIDVPVTLEIGATSVEITGNMNVLKVVGDGGTQAYGLAPQVIDIAREKYCTLLILDRAFQKVIFRSDNVQITSENWGVEAKGLMTGSVAFKAIIYQNETSR
jgi:hypothetical protein